MRKALVGLLAVAAAVFAVPAAAGATDAPSGATVYVTHGLPLDNAGTLVDVYVNGAEAINDFRFGQTVGPLTLPAATYDIEVRTPDGVTTLIQQDVSVPAGGNFSVVASFVDDRGTPGLNVFANDTKRAPFGLAKLALHHAAAAPAVDVDAGLFPISRFFPKLVKEVVSGAVNGQAATLTLPSFLRYTADVRVADTSTVVLKANDIRISSKVLTNVYVVGSAAGGTLQVISNTIPVAGR